MKLTSQKKIIVGALALVLSLMVGFAIFSESLNINGSASTGSSNFNIIFSKVNGITEKGSSGSTADISVDKKTLTVTVPRLEYPTSYAEFDVTIKNEGEINAVLKGIETQGLDNPDIKVTYGGITQDEVLGAGQEKNMKIKVTWDENSTATSANASFTITITYEQDVSGGEVTNPPSPSQSDLFVWDSETVISGLSEKGIEEVKANDGHLEIPEGVTEIASADVDITMGKMNFDKGFSPFKIGNMSMTDPDLYQKLTDPEINIVKSVSFPSTLKKIGTGAFMYCMYLTEVNLPENLEEIGDYSFTTAGITGDLTIPNKVKLIGNMSFYNTKITSLTLGNSINTIESCAFGGCRELSGELYIPDSVVTIGAGAFVLDGSPVNNKVTSISIGKNTRYEGDAFGSRPTPTVRD